ncbi:MAG: electron transfer flavoprotein subunit beta/FixA family protein [Acidobacteria bacterium]|nr:electron transfer flavoprotein subunit beta/FixA family protein [Acidobacteriota bacterium]
MKIIVCLKQIIDPEIPTSEFRIDSEKLQVVRGNAALVTNIFCDNALETALQLRERSGGNITVLSFGGASVEETLRKALAMKADEAVLVINDGPPDPDPLAVARVLARAIRMIGNYDLIMVGRESGDWGTGQTGGLLAEELNLPCINFVDQIEKRGTVLLVRRQTGDGWEKFNAHPPLVLTITNSESNVPRIPNSPDILASARQFISRWSLEDLGLSAEEISAGGSSFELVELKTLEQTMNCEFVSGKTIEEKVEDLARRIVEVTRAL